MTVTEPAQDRSHSTSAPVDAKEVDHDALYGALLRLTRTVSTLLADVERNAADLHRHLEVLRTVNQASRDLLWPPPPPDTVEHAVALFPHAVEPGDDLWDSGSWSRVQETCPGPGWTDMVIDNERHRYYPLTLLVVRRAAARGAA